MLILRLFSLALATFWSAVEQPYPEKNRSCTKPAIRREWRAFNTHEKAEWIRALNVRSIATLSNWMLKQSPGYSAYHTCLMTQLWPHQ